MDRYIEESEAIFCVKGALWFVEIPHFIERKLIVVNLSSFHFELFIDFK